MLRLGCHGWMHTAPIRVQFRSTNDKHAFLKHAKHLKDVRVRYDDDLLRLQQEQRQDMATDFDTLKSLKFRHADKTRTCKMHGATRAPGAQV